jgi:hypothetical protein
VGAEGTVQVSAWYLLNVLGLGGFCILSLLTVPIGFGSANLIADRIYWFSAFIRFAATMVIRSFLATSLFHHPLLTFVGRI